MSNLVPPHGADSLKPGDIQAEVRVKAIDALSGTGLREMFARHEPIPPEFSRAEVIAVLQQYYDGPGRE